GLRAARRPRTAPVSLLIAPTARPEWVAWPTGGGGGSVVSGPVVLASAGAGAAGAGAGATGAGGAAIGAGAAACCGPMGDVATGWAAKGGGVAGGCGAP